MTISQWMTLVLAAALMALALRSAIAPRAAALAYGIALPEGIAPTPFLEVKANRDFVLGLLLVVVTFATSSTLAYALFCGALAPAADAFTVSRHGKLSATPVHIVTFAYIIVAGALAMSGR